MRSPHKTLPKVAVLLKDKKDDHYVWHPKGAYVLIQAIKINQYKVRLAVDLWNINHDVNPVEIDAFKSRYRAYLDWLILRRVKGKGTEFYSGIGGTYNMIDVMNKEADEWMKQLWELCSDEKNLIPLPTI